MISKDKMTEIFCYYGKFWIWRNLYSGSSVFFHKCDLSGSQRDLRRVAILRAAE